MTRSTRVVLSVAMALVVLSVAPMHAQNFITLENFTNANGSQPEGSLVQGTDGNFYGTTYKGGTNSFGTVFKITPSGAMTTLYNFCAESGCPDGSGPEGQLVQGTDGNFYGTTTQGGANANTLCASGCGTVFKITSTGTLTTLYNFCSDTNCTDGSEPEAGLALGTDGNFYGTTYSGGSTSLYGTVFEITPDGTLTTLHSFCTVIKNGQCVDGYQPMARLLLGRNGDFFGTTFYGGVYGIGAVFEVSTLGTLTTLYSFCPLSNGCADGMTPQAGLVQDSDGNFYSTTYQGGAGNGTIFKLSPTGTLTTLYSFNGMDGGTPTAGVVQGTDGNFYGTTNGGGANNWGTIFQITPAGSLTTLYSFNVVDGRTPNEGLVQGTDGKFYGTSSFGGTSTNCTHGCGTVYSLDMGGGAVTLSTTALAFPKQAVSTTSNAKSVTLTNTGTIPLAISNVEIDGDFAVSAKTCGTSLAVNAKCKISVTFTPTQLGFLTGALTITDNAADSPQTVALSGMGIPPATLTPISATYASQAVGTTSSPKTFTLSNNQTVSLNSIVITTTADFAVSATACPTSLPPKSKCTISVTFAPTTTGNRTGQLSVSNDAGNSPQIATLSGTGVVPATLTPISASFGTVAVGKTSGAKVFTLTNAMNVPMDNILISTTGDFAVSTTTCATSLAAKSKCTISVTFAPTAKGAESGQLSVSDSASNSPQASSLTGTGK